MGRTHAAREKTRAAHAANRSKRVESGRLQAVLDWKCKHCSRWFSRKRNGPANHLRRCKAAKAWLSRDAELVNGDGGSTAVSLLSSQSSDKSSSVADSESSESSTDSSTDTDGASASKRQTRRAKAHRSTKDDSTFN
jgi:hypothetical protein